MRVEVRCCCQPQKLLGRLVVPGELVRAGGWVKFILGNPLQAFVLPVETLSLQLHVIAVAEQDHYLAFKAEGVSLDVLRMIRGFEEAPHAEG